MPTSSYKPHRQALVTCHFTRVNLPIEGLFHAMRDYVDPIIHSREAYWSEAPNGGHAGGMSLHRRHGQHAPRASEMFDHGLILE